MSREERPWGDCTDVTPADDERSDAKSDMSSQQAWAQFCRLTGRPDNWTPEDEVQWLRDSTLMRDDEEARLNAAFCDA